MDETKEIGFLRIIAGNPTLGLDAVDIPKIEQSVAELDCSDITSITKYGLDTQKKMAELSQVMIDNLNNSAIDEVDDVLHDTISYLYDIDTDVDGEKRILFWKRKSR